MWIFVGAVFAHWIAWIGGFLTLAAFAERLLRRKTYRKWYGKVLWSLALFCLLVACYQAWQEEHKVAERLIAEKAQLNRDNNDLRQEIGRLHAEKQKHDYTSVRVKLGSLMNEGTKLRNGICGTASDECGRKRKSWESRVEHYLLTQLDSSYASRFHASVSTVGSPWIDMGGEINELSTLIAELK